MSLHALPTTLNKFACIGRGEAHYCVVAVAVAAAAALALAAVLCDVDNGDVCEVANKCLLSTHTPTRMARIGSGTSLVL